MLSVAASNCPILLCRPAWNSSKYNSRIHAATDAHVTYLYPCRRHEVMSAKLLEYAVDTAYIDIEHHHVKQLQDIVGSGSLPRQLHWDESRVWQLQVWLMCGLHGWPATGHGISHFSRQSILQCCSWAACRCKPQQGLWRVTAGPVKSFNNGTRCRWWQIPG